MATPSTSCERKDMLAALAEIVGTENVTADECDLICYEKDFSASSTATQFTPDYAVHPLTTAHGSAIAELANRHRVPLVPRGGGTGMWGGAIPAHGGIVLDMRKMDRVVAVDEERRTVTAQAGVSVRDLATYLERRGFFVADRPESWFAATVGARTQGNGTGYYYNARYGRSIDQILDLEVVLPTGQVLHTGSAQVYDPAAGYDLTRLFSSAEGTLGLITEVTLRMYALPEHRVVTMAEFPTFGDAIGAVIAIRDSGLVPETLETMDGVSLGTYFGGRRANPEPAGDMPADKAALIVGHAGVSTQVEAQMELTRSICVRHRGCIAPEERVQRWTAFKEAYPVNPFPKHAAAAKKAVKYVLDATVPLEATADLARSYQVLADEGGMQSHGFSAVHCAPDFHSVVCARAYVDERSEKEMQSVGRMQREIHGCAERLGGGMGGAGGIGLARLGYAEDGRAPALDLMRALKRVIDPNNIMNPGTKLTGVEPESRASVDGP